MATNFQQQPQNVSEPPDISAGYVDDFASPTSDDPNKTALADPRVKDFLNRIGTAEGADYNTLVGGSKISDLSRHPNKVGLTTPAGPSTAFGKYQITGSTDRTALSKYKDLDYSPENQDLRAVELLRQTGALDHVLNDRPDEAVKKAGRVWASLPGSPLPGRKNTKAFQGMKPNGNGNGTPNISAGYTDDFTPPDISAGYVQDPDAPPPSTPTTPTAPQTPQDIARAEMAKAAQPPKGGYLPLAKTSTPGITPETQPTPMSSSSYGLEQPGVTEGVNYDQYAQQQVDRAFGKGRWESLRGMAPQVRQKVVQNAENANKIEDFKAQVMGLGGNAGYDDRTGRYFLDNPKAGTRQTFATPDELSRAVQRQGESNIKAMSRQREAQRQFAIKQRHINAERARAQQPQPSAGYHPLAAEEEGQPLETPQQQANRIAVENVVSREQRRQGPGLAPLQERVQQALGIQTPLTPSTPLPKLTDSELDALHKITPLSNIDRTNLKAGKPVDPSALDYDRIARLQQRQAQPTLDTFRQQVKTERDAAAAKTGVITQEQIDQPGYFLPETMEQDAQNRFKAYEQQKDERDRLLNSVTPADKADYARTLANITTDPGWFRAIDIGQIQTAGRLLNLVAGAIAAGGPSVAPGADALRRKVLMANEAINTATSRAPLSEREQAAAFVSSTLGDLSRVGLLTTFLGPTVGMGVDAAAQAKAENLPNAQVMARGAGGAATGAIFEVAPAFETAGPDATLRQKLADFTKSSAAVGAGTYGALKLTGASDEEATRAAVTNTLLHGLAKIAPEVGGRAQQLGTEVAARTKITPEWLRSRIAESGGLDHVVLREVAPPEGGSEELAKSGERVPTGRALSAYKDPMVPEDNAIGGTEIDAGKAESYDKRGVPVIDVTPEQYETALKRVNSINPVEPPQISAPPPPQPQIADTSSRGTYPRSPEEMSAPERAQAEREAAERAASAQPEPAKVDTKDDALRALDRANQAGDQTSATNLIQLAKQRGATDDEVESVLKAPGSAVAPAEPPARSEAPRAPESLTEIVPQMRAVVQGLGDRKVVAFTPETLAVHPLPSEEELGKAGLTAIRGPNGDQLVFRKDATFDDKPLTPATVMRMAHDGRLHELLGLPNGDNPNATVAAEVKDKDGNRLAAYYLEPGNEDAFKAQMEKQLSPYAPLTFNFGGRDLENKVVTERHAEAQAKAPESVAVKNISELKPEVASAQQPQAKEAGAEKPQVAEASQPIKSEHGRNVEMMPISELARFADRQATPNSPEENAQLKAQIQKEGITDPLILSYDPNSKRSYLYEGNNRLRIAQELGINELPVRVLRNDATPNKGTQVSGYVDEGHVPANLSPSQIGVRSRPVESTAGVSVPEGKQADVERVVRQKSDTLGTDDLPSEVQQDVRDSLKDSKGKYITDSATTRWRKLDVSTGSIKPEQFVASQKPFERESQELADAIRESGYFQPIVIGPGGIEGSHRIRAAEILGMETIPAYESLSPQLEPKPTEAQVDKSAPEQPITHAVSKSTAEAPTKPKRVEQARTETELKSEPTKALVSAKTNTAVVPIERVKPWSEARVGDLVEHEGQYHEVAGLPMKQGKAEKVAEKSGGQVVPIENKFAVLKPTEYAKPEPKSEFIPFPAEMNSLGIPRAAMPQVDNAHRGAMVQYLKGRGIDWTLEEVKPDTLNPSQTKYNPAKVEMSREFAAKNPDKEPRKILVSDDNYVVDAHHQWMRDLEDEPNNPIPIIRLHAPANVIIPELRAFPSSYEDGTHHEEAVPLGGKEHAVDQQLEAGSGEREHPRVAQGPTVREDRGEVREGQGKQAGRGDRAEPKEEKAASVEGAPEPSEVTTPIREYVKREPVQAEISDEPFEWTASRGQKMQAEAGDWRIKHPNDRIGSVKPDIFEQTYEPVKGKPGFYRKTTTTKAQQLEAPLDIKTLEGPNHGEKGDYLVTGPEGEQYIVSKGTFEGMYRPAGEDHARRAEPIERPSGTPTKAEETPAMARGVNEIGAEALAALKKRSPALGEKYLRPKAVKIAEMIVSGKPDEKFLKSKPIREVYDQVRKSPVPEFEQAKSVTPTATPYKPAVGDEVFAPREEDQRSVISRGRVTSLKSSQAIVEFQDGLSDAVPISKLQSVPATLKTKETDKGTALYAMSGESEPVEESAEPNFRVENNRIYLNQSAAQMLAEAMGERDQKISGLMIEHPDKANTATHLKRGLGLIYANQDPRMFVAERLFNAINDIFDKGHRAIAVATLPAMPHELGHVASYTAAAEKLPPERHSPEGIERLTSTPEWPQMLAGLKKRRYRSTLLPTLVEEAYGAIVGGQYESLGLTNQQAKDWLRLWFISFAEHGGDISETHFKELSDEWNNVRAAAFADLGRSRESGGTVPSVEGRGPEEVRPNIQQPSKLQLHGQLPATGESGGGEGERESEGVHPDDERGPDGRALSGREQIGDYSPENEGIGRGPREQGGVDEQTDLFARTTHPPSSDMANASSDVERSVRDDVDAAAYRGSRQSEGLRTVESGRDRGTTERVAGLPEERTDTAVSEGAEQTPEVRPQAPRQTDTPEFKKWFGDSKVVDENGDPLVVYHGSGAEFAEFDPLHIGQFATSEGKGFYFTNSRERAEGYAGYGGRPPHLYQSYLSIQHPITNVGQKTISKSELRQLFAELLKTDPDALSNYGDIDFEGREHVLRQAVDLEHENGSDLEILGSLINGGIGGYEAVMRAIKTVKGYDGVIIDWQQGERNQPDEKEYVAFLSTQIKDATGQNRTFDPSNPNILFARGEPTSLQDIVAQLREDAREAVAETVQTEFPAGVKNAVTDQDRADLGKDPIVIEAKRNIATVDRNAEASFNPVMAKAFAQEMAKNPRVMNAEETMVMIDYKVWLKNQNKDVYAKLEAARKAGDQANMVSNRIHLAQLEDEDDIYQQAARRTGYEWGLSGRVRQLLKQADYSLAEMRQRLIAAGAGEEDELGHIRLSKELEEQLAKAVQQRDEALAKLKAWDDAASQRAIEAELKRQQKEAERKQKAVERKGQVQVKTITSIVRKEKLDTELDALARQFDEIIISKFSANPFADDPDVLRLIKAMAWNRVEAGANTVEDYVGPIWERVRGKIADATERELRDAISDYGKTILPHHDELKARQSELNQLARDTSGLEDILEGHRYKRFGRPRRQKTQRERESEKRIRQAFRTNAALIEANEPEAFADARKSALDIRKQAVKNRVEDLKAYISGRETPTAKTPANKFTDAELEALTAERDVLQKVWEQMESKEFSDDQKIALAESALEKSVDALRHTIEAVKAGEKDLSPTSKLLESWSPKISFLQHAKQTLQDELAKMRKEAKPAPTANEKVLSKEEANEAAIKELQRRIDEEDIAFRRTTVEPWSRQIGEQETELADLRKQLVELRKEKTPPASEIERLMKRESSLEQSNERLRKQIADHDTALKSKTGDLWSQKVGFLEQEHQHLIDELRNLRDDDLARQTELLNRRLTRQLGDIQEMLDKKIYTKEKRVRPKPGDAETLKLRARLREADRQLESIKAKADYDQMPAWRKIIARTVGVRRAIAFSSTAILGKLTVAAHARIWLNVFDELHGGLLSATPGLSAIAMNAPTEGKFSLDAVTKMLSAAYGQQMRKSRWEQRLKIAKTGMADIDLTYGEDRTPYLVPHWEEYIGQMHYVLKYRAKLAGFTLAHQKNLEWFARMGFDPSDPSLDALAGTVALMRGDRDIMQNPNKMASVISRIEQLGRQKTKEHPNGDPTWLVMAGMMRMIFPTSRVPTNFVVEVVNRAFGLPIGAIRAGMYIGKYGTKPPLPPPPGGPPGGAASFDPWEGDPSRRARAESILRQLKQGSTGAWFWLVAILSAYGLFGFDHLIQFGGYYRKGEKRAEEDVPAGGVRVLGWDLPWWATHVPMLDVGQIVKTATQVYKEGRDAGDDEHESTWKALYYSGLGLLGEVPFFETPFQAAQTLGTPAGPSRFLGQMARGFVVPPDVQRAARVWDPKEPPTTALEKIAELTGFKRIKAMPRKPDGSFAERFGQEFELGFPGLRERVGVDRAKVERDFKDKSIDEFRALRQSIGAEKYDRIINPTEQDYDALGLGASHALWQKILTPEQRDAWNKALNSVEAGVKSGKLKPSDAETIVHDAMMTPFQLIFEHKDILKAMDAFEKMPEPNKAMVRPMLLKKSKQIANLPEDIQQTPDDKGETPMERFERLTGQPPRMRPPRQKTLHATENATQPPTP